MKDKVAFFDFCDTLVDFQTGDAFIDFIREKTKYKKTILLEKIRVFLIKVKFFAVLSKLFPTNNWHKKLKLFQLKGMAKKEIEHLSQIYYIERVKPHLITKIVEELEFYREKGYAIYIVSGGFSDYIVYFCKEFKIPPPIATNIKYKDNVCLGTIDGLDCMHATKIDKIKEVLDLSEIDLENSVAYSDSITDLPLLTLVRNGIVVSKKQAQYWAITSNLKEIII